ncbi:MAG: energy transducer TonB [Proteobacteria bacterium]|nr:energy transducer TonB [Pseudomonadota bacterium]
MHRKYLAAVTIALATATAALAEPQETHATAVPDTHDCSSFAPVFAGIKTKWVASVTVGFDVDDTGTPQKVRVLKRSGYGVMDDAAVECVKTKWRYTPRMQDGHAVADPGRVAIVEFTNVMDDAEAAH